MKGRKKLVQCSWCKRSIMRYRARKDVECPRCLAAHKHEWYLDHRAERLAAQRKRWLTMPEVRAQVTAWHKAHPEKMRAYNRAYGKRMKASMRDERRPRCDECGMTHTPASRLSILRRMEGCDLPTIREAWPCIWGRPDEHLTAAERKLFRDLAALKSSSEKQPTRAA